MFLLDVSVCPILVQWNAKALESIGILSCHCSQRVMCLPLIIICSLRLVCGARRWLYTGETGRKTARGDYLRLFSVGKCLRCFTLRCLASWLHCTSVVHVTQCEYRQNRLGTEA